MSESGGATTQAGIYYQNSVAALYLIKLLDLASLPPREQVTSVRVEAPAEVDDIVVEYADGHRHFLSAKLKLPSSGKRWNAMWKDLHAEANSTSSRPGDRISIVVAEPNAGSQLVTTLRERAVTSINCDEFRERLGVAEMKLLNKIGSITMSVEGSFELLRRIDLLVLPAADIDRDLDTRALTGSAVASATLTSLLRDMAGGYGRIRQIFRAAPLRRRLADEHNIRIFEPAEWGVGAYRAAIERNARIEIPGTGLSGRASDVILWPLVREWRRSQRSDFEDELPRDYVEFAPPVVDLRTFPSNELRRCVLVAGPGHGKSALLSALSAKLAQGPEVPALVSLSSLATSGLSVADFLNNHINREFDIKIDWRRLAEQGLVSLLLDGLDEVSAHARAPLLEKLSTFSARYPNVTWLLTVRDPAVLSGANDARILEIPPLSDSDIVRFTKQMAAHGLSVDGNDLVNRLDSYPDLKRLARIPLFLALMLATLDPDDGLPVSRTDLIERYLKTLFAPHEHKPLEGTPVSAQLLRSIAARLAFERLEQGEIGASEREVAALVSALAPAFDVERLMVALLDQGIIRRQSTIRFQFPFPIVQEYLAATYLVDYAPDTIVARIDDAIQRPWAQVLQFALELHDHPTPIMRNILARPDDAFATGLRLVARCIVNGARVEVALRESVSDHLVEYWAHAHYDARNRVGQLILDGFSHPMSPALRKVLHHHWLLNSCGGEIISRVNSSELTLSVLESLLQRPINRHRFYHVLKPAISALGNEVFERVLGVAKATDLTPDEWSGLGDILRHLLPGSVTRKNAEQAAADARLPLDLRIDCARIAGPPLNSVGDDLIKESLATGGYRMWRVLSILELAEDRESRFMGLLADSTIAERDRIDLAANLATIFVDPAERAHILARFRLDSSIPEQVAVVGLLLSARHGDRSAFEQLINSLSSLPVEIAAHAISLLGHHAGIELAERAATLLDSRALSAEDVTRFASAASIGMRYIYEMDYGFGGTLTDTQPHAGTARWAQMLDQWSDLPNLSDSQKLDVLVHGCKLGSERAKLALAQMIFAIDDPDDHRYDLGDNHGMVMREAVDEVRWWHGQIPLDLAARFARARRPNVAYAGISAIAAHGDRPALDLLLSLHAEERDWHERDIIESSIETLSKRLGSFVSRDDGGALTL